MGGRVTETSPPPASAAELRRKALALLAGQLEEYVDDENADGGKAAVPIHVRRAAAEAILKHTSEEEADGAPRRVLEMSDQELLQVIIEAREAREAAAAAVEVPRGTIASRLAASLAELADDPLLT